MLSISADMAASIAKEGATLCRVWEFIRRDGVTVRVTDHDQDVTVAETGKTYRAHIGFAPSTIVSSSTAFGSQQTEIDLIMTNDGVREQDVRLRKWDKAKAIFSIVDFENPTTAMGKFFGQFGRITLTEKDHVKIEVLSVGNSGITIAGEVYSMTCRHSLGDRGCTVNIDALRSDFTVVTVVDDFSFVATTLHDQPNGYYSFGQLIWDSGDNIGEMSEVQTSLLTNEVGLFYPPPSPIVAGDAGHIYPGCDLLIATCLSKFDNVLNFDGEPYNIQPRIIALPASTGAVGGGLNGLPAA